MTTKWAFTEPRNFDDIPSLLGGRNLLFALGTTRPAQRHVKYGYTIYPRPSEATLSHNFLAKALRADNWQFAVTFEQSAQLLAERYLWVYPEHIKRIEPVARSAFEEGKAYFERNKESLTRRYEGKYIAIWKNNVIDSDASFSTLAQRVYEKLGYVSIYMPFVTSKRRILRFHSPKYRRLGADVSAD